MSKEDSLALPFSEGRQRAVIGHLLKDYNFFLQCRHRLKKNWFIDPTNGKIYDMLVNFFNKYGRHPTLQEIENSSELLTEEYKTRMRIHAHIMQCIEDTDYHNVDVIQAELTEWLKAVLFQASVETAVGFFNNKNIKEASNSINELVRKLNEVKFDAGEAIDFLDFDTYLDEARVEFENAYSTGLDVLDEALVGSGGKGGLLRGDTTVILAPLGVGKTTVMTTMAVHNVKQNKYVMFIFHEGSARDIRINILKCYLGVDRHTLLNVLPKTEGGRALLAQAAQHLNKYLYLVDYIKPGMNVEDVEPIIRKHYEDLKAQGIELDMVFDDYPAKLGTVRNAKGNSPQRITDEIVYNYFGQLGTELNVHMVLAAQTNREASKVNKGKEDRLIKTEDTAESFGIPRMANNLISLNRDPEGPYSNIMTYYVGKSRTSRTGVAVMAKARMEYSLSHSNELGACSYIGDVRLDHKAEEYIHQYKNTVLPDPNTLVAGAVQEGAIANG